jgi:tRNA threonylcarbamoyl adenosine modification protein YeaZ
VKLLAAIEMSSPVYGVSLSSGDEVIAEAVARRDNATFEGIGPILRRLLLEHGARFEDIRLIAVDVGPGNLAAVRTALSYANALAFSLERPIYAVDSLRLLATQADADTDADTDPDTGGGDGDGDGGGDRDGDSRGGGIGTLCLRRSVAGNVYAAVFTGRGTDGATSRDGGPARAGRYRYGPIEQVVPQLTAGLRLVRCCGELRERAAELLGPERCHDTGVEFPHVSTLRRLATAHGPGHEEAQMPPSPLTEDSAIFNAPGEQG